MAVHRPPNICPFCDKEIKAKIHKRESWQPPIAGDNFAGWEEHDCDKSKVPYGLDYGKQSDDSEKRQFEPE